jgi:hypothetical protein
MLLQDADGAAEHAAAPQVGDAADSWNFERPAATFAEAASPEAAAQSESSAGSDSSTGGDSSGIDTTAVAASRQAAGVQPGQPAARSAAATPAETRHAAGPTAANETAAAGRPAPPGAEDLTAEEMAFFGYTGASNVVAAAAQGDQEQGPSSSDDSSDGTSSDSDGSEPEAGHGAEDVEEI